MPQIANGITAQDVHTTISLLIQQMVNIQDTTGQFLLRLDDGRVIDTKGWNGWEWAHGIGLYGHWPLELPHSENAPTFGSYPGPTIFQSKTFR